MIQWVIRVVVAEAHPLLRDGLSTALERTGYIKVVWAVQTSQQLLDGMQVLKAPPEIALVAVTAPFTESCDIIRKIKYKYPSVKILALSFFDDEYNIIRLVKAGAVGFLLKSPSSSELVKAVEQTYLHGYYLVDTHLEDIESKRGNLNIPEITANELHFLQLSSEGMTNKQIAERMNISHRGVEHYYKSLTQKLHCTNRINLIIKAFRCGLLQ